MAYIILFLRYSSILLAALHCLVGAKLLNTLTNGASCTVVWSVVTAVICFFVSLPRPLAQLSGLGVFSAATMGIAVLLSMIFAGVQDHPFGFIVGQEPLVTRLPVAGTTYVAGMSAFLNITYTFVGQITLPSVSLIFAVHYWLIDVTVSSTMIVYRRNEEPKRFPERFVRIYANYMDFISNDVHFHSPVGSHHR